MRMPEKGELPTWKPRPPMVPSVAWAVTAPSSAAAPKTKHSFFKRLSSLWGGVVTPRARGPRPGRGGVRLRGRRAVGPCDTGGYRRVGARVSARRGPAPEGVLDRVPLGGGGESPAELVEHRLEATAVLGEELGPGRGFRLGRARGRGRRDRDRLRHANVNHPWRHRDGDRVVERVPESPREKARARALQDLGDALLGEAGAGGERGGDAGAGRELHEPRAVAAHAVRIGDASLAHRPPELELGAAEIGIQLAVARGERPAELGEYLRLRREVPGSHGGRAEPRRGEAEPLALAGGRAGAARTGGRGACA